MLGDSPRPHFPQHIVNPYVGTVHVRARSNNAKFPLVKDAEKRSGHKHDNGVKNEES